MSGPEVALVTQFDGVETHDDGPPLLDALDRAGIGARIVPWGVPRDWSRFDLVVVRNTWDYIDRRDEFLGWAAGVESVTRLANPAAVLSWNSDKRYLRDLAGAGVPTVPTRWVEPGDELATALDGLSWDEIVVKPVVSAGARATARYGATERPRALAHLSSLADEGMAAMVQPYLGHVDRHGEAGTYVFGGSPSHAIRKGAILLPGAPPPDDFALALAQQAEALDLTDELRAFATVALDAVRPRFGDLLYARVDTLRGDDGELVLLELELIEPFLFLTTQPAAAGRFAAAVTAFLAR